MYVSSSLLTSVEQAIIVMDLDVTDVKVEAKVYYRYTDPFTPKWTGYTDKVIANILIESNEPAEKITAVKNLAIQSWAVGECLINPTPVDAKYEYNTSLWETESATPGKVIGDESYDNDLKLTAKGKKIKSESFELDKDISMENFTNPFEFAVVSISESGNDADRPHFHKITTRALQENYSVWHLFADDSRGCEGIDKAPTSNDYFSAGTTLCLMSQLTGSSEVFKHQGINIDDYRAEHQFNYQVDNYMTPKSTAHVDIVTTRILIKSNVSENVMSDYATLALQMCFAGEAVTGSTTTEIGIFQNGKLIK